jgi:hypothetical protein
MVGTAMVSTAIVSMAMLAMAYLRYQTHGAGVSYMPRRKLAKYARFNVTSVVYTTRYRLGVGVGVGSG